MALTTSLTTLASKATPRNGFGGASTVWPALSSSRITPANPDASAKAPWTRTTVGPGMGFSSGLERWPQRRYVTGPERVGPGVRPDRHSQVLAAGQAPAGHRAVPLREARRYRRSPSSRLHPGSSARRQVPIVKWRPASELPADRLPGRAHLSTG